MVSFNNTALFASAKQEDIQSIQGLQSVQNAIPVHRSAHGTAQETQVDAASQKVFKSAAADFMLLLHIDVNKTIVAVDSEKGRVEYAPIINLFLAEEYSYLWGNEIAEPMPYRTYVDKHKKIEAENEQDRNQKRKFFREHFVDFLIATNHPLKETVEADFKAIMEIMKDRFVFPSFISLIKQLRKDGINTRIILRTFGTDGVKAAEDIQRQLPEERFTTQGYFKNGCLQLQQKTISTVQEIYAFFSSNQSGNMVLRDNYEEWSINHKLQDFGKKFPVNMYDARILSLFFDDNIEEEPNSKTNIVAPIDATSGASIPVSTLLKKKMVVAAKPVQAMKNDHYFIDHVAIAMSMHETMVATKLLVSEHVNRQPLVDCVLSYL